MIFTKKVDAYIGIGANLGDPQDTVKRAIDTVRTLPRIHLQSQSKLFLTAPVKAEGPDFINAVILVKTHLTAHELLEVLHDTEQQFERGRPYPNAPRTLDLDLLLYDQQIIASNTLTVPHPRITERAFVLIPLLQIDPFICIPGKGAAHLFIQNVANQSIRAI